MAMTACGRLQQERQGRVMNARVCGVHKRISGKGFHWLICIVQDHRSRLVGRFLSHPEKLVLHVGVDQWLGVSV